uniref:15-hydroxyprostaglandin dehydrogenase n=1 Tax=Lutzomyia longipalpis TaxID=7200 RepID=A0A1B0CF96_LUTLO
MSVTDKVVLVTGACSGIGHAICSELLRSGIKVLIAWDIHSKEPESIVNLREKFPQITIKYTNVDVSLPEKVKESYGGIVRDVGSLDVVINCAGIMDESEFKKTIDINLGGVIGSTLSAIETMRKDTGAGNGGIIVNIASILGLCPGSFLPTYSATKCGVVGFHRSIAHGHDSLGIKFICICPGLTRTALYKEADTKEGFYFMYGKEQREETRKKFKPQTYV